MLQFIRFKDDDYDSDDEPKQKKNKDIVFHKSS